MDGAKNFWCFCCAQIIGFKRKDFFRFLYEKSDFLDCKDTPYYPQKKAPLCEAFFIGVARGLSPGYLAISIANRLLPIVNCQ
ncbi:hypothetical protein KJ708_03990 [bacterium]|nr:hypothetical protein [bacterium]MBU1917166.1 hypothetical protein [bacterium]